MENQSDIGIIAEDVIQEIVDIPENSNDLVLKQTIKNLAAFSSGFIIASLIDVAKGFVINIYLARLGTDEIAAGALITTSQMLLRSICCVSFVTGIEVGKIIKATDSTEESRANSFSEIVVTSTVFSGLASIPLVVICANMGPVFIAFGQDPKLADIAGVYYDGYVWGVPATLMLAFLQQFIIGHGEAIDGKLFFNSTVLNALSISLVGYLLAFGAGELPAYKTFGLGATNSIVAWGNLLGMIAIAAYSERYNKGINMRSPRAWEHLRVNLLRYGTVGGAIAVRAFSEVISLFIITLMISKMGNDKLVAEQIAIQYTLLIIVPLFALSQATTITASPYIALKDHKNVATISRAGSIYSSLLSTIIGVIYCAVPEQLISLFINTNQNNGIYITARNLLYINAAIQIPDAVKNIICGVLNAMEDPYTPLIAGVGVNVGVSLALGYVLGFPAELGAEGIFIARLLTTLVAMVILQRAFVNFDFNRHKTNLISQRASLFSCRLWTVQPSVNSVADQEIQESHVGSNYELVSQERTVDFATIV